MLTFKFFLENGLVASKYEMQVRIPGQRGQGTFHLCLRRMVAAEAVYQQFDHLSFFIYER